MERSVEEIHGNLAHVERSLVPKVSLSVCVCVLIYILIFILFYLLLCYCLWYVV